MKLKNIIIESFLSRIRSHVEKYDISMMTAFRGISEKCVIYPFKDEGKEYSKADNLQRNKTLYASLLKLHYGVTKIDGSYIENFGTPEARESKENSFFIVNINNDQKFIDNIIKLGKYYCQDSVLIKPTNQEAYLYGTNNSEFPGLNNKEVIGNFFGGIENQFLSRIRNRPFVFKEIFDSFENYNNSGKYLIDKNSELVLEYLNT
jgi:hypothetical protein